MRFVVAVLFAIGMVATASAAGQLNDKQEASWKKYMHAQHQSLCVGGSAPCNICEVRTQYGFARGTYTCKTTVTGPAGQPCRCASSNGWQKGSVVILDPDLGLIDANGKLRRDN